MAGIKWNKSPLPKWKGQLTTSLLFLCFAVYWWSVFAFALVENQAFILWFTSLGWSALSLTYGYLSWKNYTPNNKCANCRVSQSESATLDTGLRGIGICRRCVSEFADQIISSSADDKFDLANNSSNPFQSPTETTRSTNCDFCDRFDRHQVRFGQANQFTICESCIDRFVRRNESS